MSFIVFLNCVILYFQLGVSNVEDLKHVLGTAEDSQPTKAMRDDSKKQSHSKKTQSENLFYRDSSTFLKVCFTLTFLEMLRNFCELHLSDLYLLQGTQSSNPHNDYCQHFVDTGQRPQNFIRDVGLADRFEEYPKLRELIRLKDDLIAKTATPPMYLQADLKKFDLKTLGVKFDVILIEPPLEVRKKKRNEYQTCIQKQSHSKQLNLGIHQRRWCISCSRSCTTYILFVGRNNGTRYQ